MRVYQFLKADYALLNLQHSRLKASDIDKLNDPFEFSPFRMPSKELEASQHEQKQKVSDIYKLLCFSETYSDPTMWAYYADKHFGICLGFEISTHILIPVEYKTERLPFPYLEHLSLEDWQKLVVMPFVSTKAESWKHEKERRMLVTLDDCVKEDGKFYYPFNINVKLEEVILGLNFFAQPGTVFPDLPPFAKLFRAILSSSNFAIERVEIHRWPSQDA